MKHISEIIEDILVEWAYRVHDGMPNPQNALHIQELRESMEELKLPNNVIYQVIKNLLISLSLKLPQIALPIRVALLGKKYSPSIYIILVLIGKNESLKRIKKAFCN